MTHLLKRIFENGEKLLITLIEEKRKKRIKEASFISFICALQGGRRSYCLEYDFLESYIEAREELAKLKVVAIFKIKMINE